MSDQLLCQTTDRTINRDGQRYMVRSIVASCDRSYEQSWHPACDRSYKHSWHHGTRLPIVRSIGGGGQPSIARSIVASILWDLWGEIIYMATKCKTHLSGSTDWIPHFVRTYNVLRLMCHIDDRLSMKRPGRQPENRRRP